MTATTCSDCGAALTAPAFTFTSKHRRYTYCKACVEKRLPSVKKAAKAKAIGGNPFSMGES